MTKISFIAILIITLILLPGCITPHVRNEALQIEYDTDETVPQIFMDAERNVVTPLTEMGEFTVFWALTGTRYHINPLCSTLRNAVLFGTLDEARAAGRDGWCGICSTDWDDDGFLEMGNPFIR
ncbi:MAG: hypothetical protein FWC95_07410 [Defluviitaleaceae bacterium]|nr:hypothetical protein [Defluviitaleaceae bacterium]